MTPEEKARQQIDARLEQSGWVVQDLKKVNPMASLGVAVREYPTSTGPVDYALFIDEKPVGVIEAKKDGLGENITVVEGQSGRVRWERCRAGCGPARSREAVCRIRYGE